LVFVALCVTSLLAALEGTVTSTALPTIVADLHIGDNYPWVSNAYFLTTYVKYLHCASLPLSTESNVLDIT
jgi:MFS family permease